MNQHISGNVRDLGRTYKNGFPVLEIHVPINRANGLPYQTGRRVPVNLNINGIEYLAGLRSTSANGYVWICPDIYRSRDERYTLGWVLTEAGYKANDSVQLLVKGKTLTVERPWGDRE